MTWWTNADVEIKQKSKFVVAFAETFFLPNVQSVTKPSINIDTKEFLMINHTFKYPGVAKWNPITINFVDMNGNGKVFDTAVLLNQMLNNTGYATPDTKLHSLSFKNSPSGSGITVPEKSSTVANSFGTGLDGGFSVAKVGGSGTVVITQISPDSKAVETWTLYNPIIRMINFGDLSYEEDGAVQYSMEIDYDYAKLT